jgi:hypothetical protein
MSQQTHYLWERGLPAKLAAHSVRHIASSHSRASLAPTEAFDVINQ